jgi:BlaI family penicillinase repressor
MDIVYERGKASAQDVLEAMQDPPSYSAVRALLKVLEDKGHLAHEQEGAKYVFLPTRPHEEAAESALQQVVRTFFGGNAAIAAATLISGEGRLSEDEAARLNALIEEAMEKGR